MIRNARVGLLPLYLALVAFGVFYLAYLARAAVVPLAVALLLAYAGVVHHGVGPLPEGSIELYSPREFLLRQAWIEPFQMRPTAIRPT